MIDRTPYCGHLGHAGTCKACGKHYCRECGAPQVVTVRKTQWVQVQGRPFPDQVQSDVREMWPLCYACAAITPPVWVEPAPPPPVTITTTVSNQTNPVDWSRAVKMFEALSANKVYTGFAKETTFGKSPVTKLVEEERARQAAPPKPPKPKKTPQSALEADVERFLREQDDD